MHLPFIFLYWSLVRLHMHYRHLLRGRRTSKTACQVPSLLGDGDKWIEIVVGEEKIFCTGPTRAAKAVQNLPARRAQRTPFICTPWVPICLSFNSQQGPPLSSLSVRHLECTIDTGHDNITLGWKTREKKNTIFLTGGDIPPQSNPPIKRMMN
jgi:hypothetical protein